MNQLNDLELLETYSRQRSEEAFRELVTRHVDFIYSAAMRQLRNPHLAQEATQSAFIALANKAGQLRRGTVVAGWLHRAVTFAALKLQRSEARRKHWEKEAAAVNLSGVADPFGSLRAGPPFPEGALPQVDGALAELNEIDRSAVILRFLQQKAVRDVAQALGTSEDAAKKRVSRALEKLRELLSQRGVAISAAALATGLSQIPTIAAPANLPATLGTLAGQSVPPALFTLTVAAGGRLAAVIGLVFLGGTAVLWWSTRLGSTTTASPSPASTNAPAGTPVSTPSMKIKVTSVMVNDQDKALKFYTEVLGFAKKTDLPVAGGRRLTVVSPAEPDGPELLLEPMGFPPARTFQSALFRAGIPLTAFMVDDLQKKYAQLTNAGVLFSMKPKLMGPTTFAVFNDTCGNRIQLFQPSDVTNTPAPLAPRIKLVSVMVPDQDQALRFYTEVLGFVKKEDMPAGGARWITVVSPQQPDGPELVLEPLGFASARTYQKALFEAGLPLASFTVENLQHEHQRLTNRGVVFPVPPRAVGPVTVAVLEDTCGNLIQLAQ